MIVDRTVVIIGVMMIDIQNGELYLCHKQVCSPKWLDDDDGLGSTPSTRRLCLGLALGL